MEIINNEIYISWFRGFLQYFITTQTLNKFAKYQWTIIRSFECIPSFYNLSMKASNEYVTQLSRWYFITIPCEFVAFIICPRNVINRRYYLSHINSRVSQKSIEWSIGVPGMNACRKPACLKKLFNERPSRESRERVESLIYFNSPRADQSADSTKIYQKIEKNVRRSSSRQLDYQRIYRFIVPIELKGSALSMEQRSQANNNNKKTRK